MARTVSRVSRTVAMLTVAVGVMACATPQRRTDEERKADLAIARQVEAALTAQQYVDVEHVKVEARRGVVRLSGLVATDVDLREVLRTSQAVPGVRDVVDDLEIIEFGRKR